MLSADEARNLVREYQLEVEEKMLSKDPEVLLQGILGIVEAAARNNKRSLLMNLELPGGALKTVIETLIRQGFEIGAQTDSPGTKMTIEW